MSDRTSSEIFGNVFEALAKRSGSKDARPIAEDVWLMTSEYDFHPSDMCADDALHTLGLARPGKPDEYGDVGLWMYRQADGSWQ